MENLEENTEKNTEKLKKIENFAKNLEGEFSNFGESGEKNEKNNENSINPETPHGWTIRDFLDCFGVGDWQALLALSDKKIYEIALKDYPIQVQQACGTYSGISSGMANFRAKTIEKLMKKYSYNIDMVISDEIACALAIGISMGSIFAQAKMTANKVQKDLETLERKD